MKFNWIKIIILVFPIVALWSWLCIIQAKINNSTTIKIAVTGYDPRDLLSGHYIDLRLFWDKTDCSQFEDKKCHKEYFNYNYRYYLPEHKAIELDRIIRNQDLEMYLEFALPYNNSEPVITNFYVEGVSWQEWMQKNQEKSKDGY